MTAEEIIKILDSLAVYIVYLYPGYLSIYVYNFLKANTVKDSKGIIIKSIAISFLYKIWIDKLPITTDVYYHFVMVILAVVVPYLCYMVQKSEGILDLFEYLDIDTRFENNEIEILDNGEISAWIRVYLKEDNVVYEGFLGEKELEPGKRQFITLKKYRKYILDADGRPKKPYIEESYTDEDMVLLFYQDVYKIEKVNISSESMEPKNRLV